MYDTMNDNIRKLIILKNFLKTNSDSMKGIQKQWDYKWKWKWRHYVKKLKIFLWFFDKIMEIYEKMLKFEDFVAIFTDTMVGIQINKNIVEKASGDIFW